MDRQNTIWIGWRLKDTIGSRRRLCPEEPGPQARPRNLDLTQHDGNVRLGQAVDGLRRGQLEPLVPWLFHINRPEATGSSRPGRNNGPHVVKHLVTERSTAAASIL